MWDNLTFLQKAIALFVIIIGAIIAFKVIVAVVIIAWNIFTYLFPLILVVAIIYTVYKFVQGG